MAGNIGMRQLKIGDKSPTSRENASLNKYLYEIRKEKRVTAEEEVILAQRIRQGDQVALDKLCKANLLFVISVAKKYQNRWLTLPDLINEGNLGLIKAAGLFDETKGFKFITYAVRWIRQSILQALAEQTKIVRLPLNQVKNINYVRTVMNILEQEFERDPTIAEITETVNEKYELDRSEEKVAELLGYDLRHSSLDRPFDEWWGNEQNLYDVLIGSDGEKEVENATNDSALRMGAYLHVLDTRSQVIVILREWLDGGVEQTFAEIGEKVGVSWERTRQEYEKALRKMRYKCSQEQIEHQDMLPKNPKVVTVISKELLESLRESKWIHGGSTMVQFARELIKKEFIPSHKEITKDNPAIIFDEIAKFCGTDIESIRQQHLVGHHDNMARNLITYIGKDYLSLTPLQIADFLYIRHKQPQDTKEIVSSMRSKIVISHLNIVEKIIPWLQENNITSTIVRRDPRAPRTSGRPKSLVILSRNQKLQQWKDKAIVAKREMTAENAQDVFLETVADFLDMPLEEITKTQKGRSGGHRTVLIRTIVHHVFTHHFWYTNKAIIDRFKWNRLNLYTYANSYNKYKDDAFITDKFVAWLETNNIARKAPVVLEIIERRKKVKQWKVVHKKTPVKSAPKKAQPSDEEISLANQLLQRIRAGEKIQIEDFVQSPQLSKILIDLKPYIDRSKIYGNRLAFDSFITAQQIIDDFAEDQRMRAQIISIIEAIFEQLQATLLRSTG